MNNLTIAPKSLEGDLTSSPLSWGGGLDEQIKAHKPRLGLNYA